MNTTTTVPTYKKTVTIENPIVEIWHDDYSHNPLDDYGDSLSFAGGQKEIYGDIGEALSKILFSAAEEACSQNDHKERALKEAQEQCENAYIYPVYKYEHSNVSYSTTPFSCSFDSCLYGLIAINKTEVASEEQARELITSLLKDYTSATNGEVYGFTLFNTEGEEIDSCGGFYDMEDMKEYLPEELQGVDLYALLP